MGKRVARVGGPDRRRGCGTAFKEFKRYNDAFAAFDKAAILDPGLAEPWLGRADLFFELKRQDEALTACDKALALKPDLDCAWACRGNVLTELKRHDEAFAAYDKAVEITPDLPGIAGLRLNAKMLCCNWVDFDKDRESLLAAANNKIDIVAPFQLLNISANAQEQFEYAALWTSHNYPVPPQPIWNGEIYKNKKIRIGYLSSDFRQHVVAYLVAGIFESHDREHFETFALSTGYDDKSAMRDRLTRAFDEFIDLSGQSDRYIANKIRSLNIDIVVDLMGYTSDARGARIFVQRPAPVQAVYLGFAGTMGANFFDYLIADRTVIPPSLQMHYAEKIVYLPDCFMPNDITGRLISDKAFVRSDFGLPETGFVFCCFNNGYKLNPKVFQSWMTIMKATDGSVLWLSELHKSAERNLAKEAEAAGVDPKRLIFAKLLTSSAEHLARQRLADLFLDTTPYNAHTTASDALWGGLPVLTRIGETYAARVAASLVKAVGLSELVTRSPAEYKSLAIELANNPAKLAEIRQKLKINRLAMPLFDTQLFTRHLEDAYRAMYRRYQAGLAPDHIAVAREESSEAATTGELVVSEVE